MHISRYSTAHIDQLVENAMITYHRFGKRTLVGFAVFENGFEITESCACLDSEQFDLDFAKSLVKSRITNTLTKLEGYSILRIHADD